MHACVLHAVTQGGAAGQHMGWCLQATNGAVSNVRTSAHWQAGRSTRARCLELGPARAHPPSFSSHTAWPWRARKLPDACGPHRPTLPCRDLSSSASLGSLAQAIVLPRAGGRTFQGRTRGGAAAPAAAAVEAAESGHLARRPRTEGGSGRIRTRTTAGATATSTGATATVSVNAAVGLEMHAVEAAAAAVESPNAGTAATLRMVRTTWHAHASAFALLPSTRAPGHAHSFLTCAHLPDSLCTK
eukprot:352941-Chlamydomonas_euryale.AAC.6